jgi:hypothetical protein
MELWIKLAWAALVVIHLSPAAVAFSPDLVTRLYGVPAGGGIGVLLIHRGALFLALVAAAIIAIFDPSARRVVSVIFAISMLAFLLIYVRAGMPAGGLRKIAMIDLIGLLPLTFVAITAWK